MDAIEALHSRVSVARFTEEPPAPAILHDIFRAGLRAADHAALRPWRFITISGVARARLGEVMAAARRLEEGTADPASVERERRKPLRAPLIVVVVAVIRDHPSVPAIEQLLSAGAAAQNMLVAAHAQGVGAMWRTGRAAYHPTVLGALGVTGNERIVGFLYLGRPAVPARTPPDLTVDSFVVNWTG